MMMGMWAGGRRAGRAVRRAWSSRMRHLREGWRPALARTTRLTGAATAAYLVATRMLSDVRPLTAALTALLIVQVTLVSTVTDSLRRILSVIAGVIVAIAFASVFGFSVASLALLVAASLVVGQLLRLGAHLLEVPISAMLVLGVNGAHAAATDRIAETIVGAVVGLLVSLLFPPRVQTSAGAAVEQFSADLARLLDEVAEGIATAVTPDRAQEWLEEARRLSNSTERLDQLLAHARDSRRLNPRAVGRPDTLPDLRAGLVTLEHCAVALRGLYRSVADRVRDQPEAEHLYGEDIRGAFAVLLLELAEALRSFGALVRAEAEAGDPDPAELAERGHGDKLAAALESVHEPRARLAELLSVDPREAPDQWEQRGALLAAVERVLRELDLEEHARERQRRRRLAEEARASSRPVTRLRTATRQVTDLPFRWRD